MVMMYVLLDMVTLLRTLVSSPQSECAKCYQQWYVGNL